jgi:hypothetical protein
MHAKAEEGEEEGEEEAEELPCANAPGVGGSAPWRSLGGGGWRARCGEGGGKAARVERDAGKR